MHLEFAARSVQNLRVSVLLVCVFLLLRLSFQAAVWMTGSGPEKKSLSTPEETGPRRPAEIPARIRIRGP